MRGGAAGVRDARGGPAWRRRAGLAALAAGLACATPGAPPEVEEAERLRGWLEETLAARPPAEPGVLSVHLAFSADVDLDLYVTDPSQETVYFANSPSRSGGRLYEDLQCGSPEPEEVRAPRAERVRYAAPAPGRYRVSVDYPRSCARARPAGYALAVEHGGRVQLQTGTLRLREFRLVALEFDVGAGR